MRLWSIKMTLRCFLVPSGVDTATIQRAAAGLPSNIYNTLAQVVGATPHFQNTNFNSATTPASQDKAVTMATRSAQACMLMGFLHRWRFDAGPV